MLTKFLGTGLARMGISLSVILFSLNVMAAAYPYMESISINGYALSEGGSITVEGFEVGDTIKLRIGVRNTGDQPSPPAYNNITVSFPSYTSSGDVTRVAVDSVNTSLNLNYSEYYGSGLGGDGYAEYVMVESVSLNTWQVDEDRYLELYIEPDDYGTFVINYRAAMSDQRSWTSGWSFNPPSGVVTDCLSFPTYTISVILPDPIPGQNHAPSKASNPQPSHDSSNASLYVHLDWNDASDPDGDSVGYEVYFGTNGSPGSEEYKGTMPTSDYDPGILQYNTDYYWRIDTTDGDLTTTGDVWHFKTQAATFPPGPELLSYVINKTDVQVNEAFTITVQGRNKGTSTAPSGGIAVQVRQVLEILQAPSLTPTIRGKVLSSLVQCRSPIRVPLHLPF
ncbi:MAG: hypothetical protein HY788_21760 [Deltaproteobacteria bacterium]|nr:hypothetical protein [Deltaproteobacteria bacterium]